ncbi:hypothetical protein [Paracoccus yeei]|uniref:hypothetical protein n=1 Tax=Paracoccus yeei TaxID=147645 RepID=UPI00174BDC38|nr:hypothetical protein [Paracoccus yeei]
MNASIDDLAKALMAAGIEKLSISSPVYTMRDEPTRPTERGMWQVSVKANSLRNDWKRGRWKPTLAEAIESCLGPVDAEKPTSTTSLTEIL